MGYLKTSYNNMKLYFSAFIQIWQDILFKVAGTLFPFYIGAVILYFLKRDEIDKVFDQQSFILYSATFIFSTLYLWYKTVDSKKNGIINLLFFIVIIIIISLLYSFSLIGKIDSNTDSKKWSYIIFFITLIFYVYYECKTHINNNKSTFYKNTESAYNSLEDSFDNFKEKEDGE